MTATGFMAGSRQITPFRQTLSKEFIERRLKGRDERNKHREKKEEKIQEAASIFRRAVGKKRLGVSRACLLKGPLLLPVAYRQGCWAGQDAAWVYPARGQGPA